MIVKAFRMRVHPQHVAEYERRHNPIWPELEATLRAHGVSRYFIFLDDDTCDLFAYAEIDSEERWQAIAATDVCRRWWQSMQALMPSSPDASPESRDLRPVFQL
jgi:L-rhamnose mutarotase